MAPPDLRVRTKDFALRVLKVYRALPRKREARIYCDQLLRSSSSIGSNCREATRARSHAEYISKVGQSLQELDETRYWLELLVEGEIVSAKRLESLLDENDQLIAIFVTLAKRAGDKRRTDAG